MGTDATIVSETPAQGNLGFGSPASSALPLSQTKSSSSGPTSPVLISDPLPILTYGNIEVYPVNPVGTRISEVLGTGKPAWHHFGAYVRDPDTNGLERIFVGGVLGTFPLDQALDLNQLEDLFRDHSNHLVDKYRSLRNELDGGGFGACKLMINENEGDNLLTYIDIYNSGVTRALNGERIPLLRLAVPREQSSQVSVPLLVRGVEILSHPNPNLTSIPEPNRSVEAYNIYTVNTEQLQQLINQNQDVQAVEPVADDLSQNSDTTASTDSGAQQSVVPTAPVTASPEASNRAPTDTAAPLIPPNGEGVETVYDMIVDQLDTRRELSQPLEDGRICTLVKVGQDKYNLTVTTPANQYNQTAIQQNLVISQDPNGGFSISRIMSLGAQMTMEEARKILGEISK